MGLVDIVRDGVALAKSITDDLQETVTHKVWTGQDMFGTPTFSSVSRKALIETKQQKVISVEGQEVVSHAVVTFLEQITVNPGKDEITLQTGETYPILATSGFVDAATNYDFFTIAYLG